jgi:hypothetical protein
MKNISFLNTYASCVGNEVSTFKKQFGNSCTAYNTRLTINTVTNGFFKVLLIYHNLLSMFATKLKKCTY